MDITETVVKMRGNAKVKRAAKRNLTRAEKTEATQRALFDAAVKVIGASGYVDASIAKITQTANVAQGTFYNYFSSQQELFNQLLPLIGQRLIDRIREGRSHHASPVERERVGFETFFEFLLDVPEFYRLLTEAETFAPEAHRAHTDNMAAGYVRALRRLHAEGWLKDFRDQEFEPIAYMLIGMRHYLAMRYSYRPDSVHRLPSWISDAYIKILAKGLFEDSGRKPTGREIRTATEEGAWSQGNAQARLLEVRDGHAVAEAELGSENAAVVQGVLSNVAATAAHAAAAADNGNGRRISGTALTIVNPARRGRLVAAARIEAVGETTVVHVSIHQGKINSPQIALAMISFAQVYPDELDRRPATHINAPARIV